MHVPFAFPALHIVIIIYHVLLALIVLLKFSSNVIHLKGEHGIL